MLNPNPTPQSLTQKIKDSTLILITANISPYLLSLFHYPISLKHYIFLNSISLASIILVLTSQQSKQNPIQQVFEANKIHINNQYPILLKPKGGKQSNDQTN